MKRCIASCIAAALFLSLQTSPAQTIFYDDFEAGLGNWVQNAASPLELSTAQNILPAGGIYSAQLNLSTDRMTHNLGAELTGAHYATWYIYDDAATRVYGEVRAYTGAGFADGTLQNAYAIGKYSSVTMAGETYDGTKYQGRIANPTASAGWFNLNAPGAPSRSTGWHRFDIARMPDGTTYNFYVDGILGRTFTGASDFSWDSVTCGSVVAGSSTGNAWFDGVSVNVGVPEPSTYALIALGALGLWIFRMRRK